MGERAVSCVLGVLFVAVAAIACSFAFLVGYSFGVDSRPSRPLIGPVPAVIRPCGPSCPFCPALSVRPTNQVSKAE